MKLKFKASSTSRLLRIFVQDSSSTTGAGLTGLTNASSGLTWSYIREGASSVTTMTAGSTIFSATLGTFTSGGFKEIDATNLPGMYEIGVPNAAIAGGAKSVHMMLKGATNMVPVLIEIELDAVDYQDATRFGLTSLPAAVPAAAGGLPTVDASNNVHGLAQRTCTDTSTIGTGTANAGDKMDLVNAIDEASLGTLATYLWQTSTPRTITGGTVDTLSGNVTVGAYAAGKDPGTYVLLTPTNKLGVDVNNRVTVGGFATNLTDAGGILKVDVEHAQGGTSGAAILGTLYGMVSAGAYTVAALANAPSGGGGGGTTGSGNTPVNHNTNASGGTTADTMRVTTAGGVGIPNVVITAYLSSSYAAGAYLSQGQTTTAADGRWAAPLMLSAGNAYTIVFAKSGQFNGSTATVALP